MRGLPVFDGAVDVRHDGRRKTSLANRSTGDIVWRAAFDGAWDTLEVDGTARSASRGADGAGRPVSWVEVNVSAGKKTVVIVPAAR